MTERFWAFSPGSPPLPPSPTAAYRKPSGPNAIWPPLWFPNCECGITRRMRSEAGSAMFGSAVTVYRAITMSPALRTGGVGVGHARVVDEEEAVGRVLGVEREPQQAALAAAGDAGADVEEARPGLAARRAHHRAVHVEANAARLLDHEQPVAVVSGAREPDGGGEPGGSLQDDGEGGQRRLGITGRSARPPPPSPRRTRRAPRSGPPLRDARAPRHSHSRASICVHGASYAHGPRPRQARPSRSRYRDPLRAGRKRRPGTRPSPRG